VHRCRARVAALRHSLLSARKTSEAGVAFSPKDSSAGQLDGDRVRGKALVRGSSACLS
jgi:hypothetical protein